MSLDTASVCAASFADKSRAEGTTKAMVNYGERTFQYKGGYSYGNSPTFSSALLEAISRSTESSADQNSNCKIADRKKYEMQGYRETRPSGASFDVFPGFDSRFSRSRVRDYNERFSSRSAKAFSTSSHSSSSSSSVVMRDVLSKSVSQAKSKDKDAKKRQKSKQPMSPGTRLANFINALFSANSVKKSKSKRSDSASTSSSVSTPPSVHEFLATRNEIRQAIMEAKLSFKERERNHVQKTTPKVARRFETPADTEPRIFADYNKLENHRNLLAMKLRQHLKLLENGIIPSEYLTDSNLSDFKRVNMTEEVEDDEDDLDSDASSDLFELENFKALDRGLYAPDLPVYETTDINTNNAIAIARRHR
eukprot:TRINITY_DN1932_c0_g1_i2.p1 TRINITY_DN1932_c0_g1~~TRINITY_DN1932_c0_g1_i2.p1  ORF type:complete len:365 (-),score=12.24 TRINITY_DN1932_c0_g1_i2:259-1353(-)